MQRMFQQFEGPKTKSFEMFEIPEIVIQREQGAHLFSLILKAHNPDWGGKDSALAKETNKHFEENPLHPEIPAFLEKIKALQGGGVDEEVLYILALTYKHAERTEQAFEVIAKYKPYIEDSQELQQGVFRVLQLIEESPDLSLLEQQFVQEAEKDMAKRQNNLPETEQRIQGLIDFFKPDPTTTNIQKIILTPTDPLYKKDSGRGFVFGNEQVLMSHIENPNNLEHEFLHAVINPIIDKLLEKLTDQQKERILQIASNKLKQDYGESSYSILCEELIRTFNDVFKKRERPQTYEDFLERISEIDEEQFQASLLQSESLKARCEELAILTIEDFKEKSQEYFEQFEKNQLRDLIFELYQEYSQSDNNFESFILEQLPNKI